MNTLILTTVTSRKNYDEKGTWDALPKIYIYLFPGIGVDRGIRNALLIRNRDRILRLGCALLYFGNRGETSLK